MTFKISDEPQTIKIFNLSASTMEFIGDSDAYIPAHTGLPAYSTTVKPPSIPDGKVAVFNEEKSSWVLMEDHRGISVYDTDSGSMMIISEIGPLPQGLTAIAPDGQFQKWDGEQWIKDEEAEKASLLREAETKKSQLMQIVNESITILQDAVDLEEATDEEKDKLVKLKKYRIALSRVDLNNPVWPDEV